MTDWSDHPLTAELIAVSNCFGGDPAYVRAGGGNASVKVDGLLCIKPSGTPLATLTASDLVPLRLDVLLDALHSDAPVDGDPVRDAAQRAQVGNPTRRPSVEILFHALMPEPLVLHLHPVGVNAVTCNHDGEALTASLFGDDAVWVPYIDPGVPLARGIEAARAAYTERTGRPAPPITLLGNHGIIVSGDTAAEVAERTERVTAVINEVLAARPLPADPEADAARTDALINAVAPRLRGLLGTEAGAAVVTADTSALAHGVDASAHICADGPLIPDQIVYAGSFPLVLDLADPADAATAVPAALASYRATHGRNPVIVVLPGVGVLAVGSDQAKADTALTVFLDHVIVARDADRLGAVRVMSAPERSFIETWEAEAYRQAQAAKGASGRLAGRVAMVTGAAQGFGLGITESLLAEGASVVLADLNVELAGSHAARLASEHGVGRAQAVRVDVSDPQSCLDAVAAAVRLYGGVDLFVSNAGVLRAEGVMTQPVADFDLGPG